MSMPALSSSQSLRYLPRGFSAFEQKTDVNTRSIFTKLSSAVCSVSHWSTQNKILGAVGITAGFYVGALCTIWALKSFGFRYCGLGSILPWWPFAQDRTTYVSPGSSLPEKKQKPSIPYQRAPDPCAPAPAKPKDLKDPEKIIVKKEEEKLGKKSDSTQELNQPKIITTKAPIFTKPPLLRNGGNTCYIDSVVTSLIMNKNFCEAICALEEKVFETSVLDKSIEQSISDLKSEKIDEKMKKRLEAQIEDLINRKKGVCFLKELRLLILSLGDGAVVDSSKLENIHTAARAWFGGLSIQQDARILLTRILETLESLSVWTSVFSLQRGHSFMESVCSADNVCQRSITWLPKDEKESFGIEPLVTISLLDETGNCIKKSSLEQRIFPEEKVSDQCCLGVSEDFVKNSKNYICEKCGASLKRSNFIRFVSAPQVLIFNIKRFGFVDGKDKKITSKDAQVLISETLDIKKLEDGCSDELKKSGKTNYVLSSVVCHSGSLDFGHYVTYVKCKNDWYLMNDSSLSAQLLGEKDKKDLFDGKPLVDDPYLVFYDQQP